MRDYVMMLKSALNPEFMNNIEHLVAVFS